MLIAKGVLRKKITREFKKKDGSVGHSYSVDILDDNDRYPQTVEIWSEQFYNSLHESDVVEFPVRSIQFGDNKQYTKLVAIVD